MIRAFLCALGLLALAGCAQTQARPVDAARRASVRSVYVVPFAGDSRGVADLLVADLRARGLQATQGPDDADAIATARADALLLYQPRWQWDISMYLVTLDVQLRDPATRSTLAVGQSYRPSLERVSPERMVHEVLDAVLGPAPVSPSSATAGSRGRGSTRRRFHRGRRVRRSNPTG